MTKVSPSMRKILWRVSHGRCHWCRRRMRRDVGPSHPRKFTVDHIKPKAAGGVTNFSNLAACCFRCNQRRAADFHRRIVNIERATFAKAPQ